jgi:hypothetical protein
MTRIILLVFGATFLYTGLLVYDREPTASICLAVMGIVLLVKPALEAGLYLRTHFNRGQFGRSQFNRGQQTNKPEPSRKKGHLRMVKPRENNHEDKPTIH